MYPRDIRVNSPNEAMIVEQALAMYREMKQTADAAPDGDVLSQAETMAVERGRELTRKSLEAVVNELAEPLEKKGRLPELADVAVHDITAEGASGRS